MRGAVSLMIQVVFAALLVLLAIAFIWNRVMVPSLTSYGNEHAQLAASSLATSINMLSTQESGTVYRELGLAWDVNVFHKENDALISVSHGGFKSGDIILIGDAEDFSAKDASGIYVVKEPGKRPRLKADTTDADKKTGEKDIGSTEAE